MPHLIVRQPGQVAFSLPLRDGFTVGRHEKNDLSLHDEQVSREHAAFSLGPRGYRVDDRGSTHGTWVNGAQTDGADLEHGDVVQVGGVLLEYARQAEARDLVVDMSTRVEKRPTIATPSDRRLQLLYETGAALRAIEDLDALLDRMLRAVVEELGAERGVIGELRGPGARHLAVARPPSDAREIVVSRSLMQSVVERREGVIVHEVDEANRSLAREGVLSAMCVPLLGGPRAIGFIYVDHRSERHRFEGADLAYLGALGQLVAAAIDASQRYQQAVEAGARAGDDAADQLLGASRPMQALLAQLRKYAAAGSANVLVRGETGVGKELVARSLHRGSPRAAQPFLTVNCAAIPETMIESELFGYEKGAFTGATRDRRGKFVLAHKGTLFLDEIGDLSASAQAKVLRAIQEGEVQPLGAEKSLHVDARIIAATHKDLRAEIAAGRFREDLYYRLAVVEIEVPSLRERGPDIALLADALLSKAAARVGKRFDGFTPEAVAALSRYTWPGNVRELSNEVERAAILADTRLISAADLSPRVLAAEKRPEPAAAAAPGDASLAKRFADLEIVEKELVATALALAGGNVSEAARLLGITRIMARRRVERFQLQASDDD